ncbi:nucleoside hydrolase [Pseudoroseomonas ludipueritiae]|uniref:Nucleoside hydrolase n=1 Tax=Pseudoroseomonas ludipueritiae TaxID=198093 RepID=A0ABR7R704_9PROT|nr:nucleoside hydrolase [Pseudoroseomonas ludipueritiae]MBC9177498.1 nucleoside hydrolase [Pseudoroseomonas ludipueritiae]
MRRIIIDTDPGKDDAVAILLALAAPEELELVSITTVAGNVPLSRTTANALALLELGGRAGVPVFPGCARPMIRLPITAEHVHGETGLQGLVLPEAQAPARPQHAVDHLIEALLREPAGSITLCLLGPATNLAMALVKAPEIAPRIGEVIWMAGARSEGGNVTPAAEYNVYADPEAAAVLLDSGVPLTMLPLDLTHQVLMTRDRLLALRKVDTAAARAVAVMFGDADGNPQREREKDGIPLHDPCVIAHLLDPTLFTGRRINVAVETASPVSLGMTVADWFHVTGRPQNALWLNETDADRFFELLLTRLARLP